MRDECNRQKPCCATQSGAGSIRSKEVRTVLAATRILKWIGGHSGRGTDLHFRSGLAAYALVSARSVQAIRRIRVPDAMIVCVVAGSKHASRDGLEVTARAGEWLAVPAGEVLDIRNEPNDCAYFAICLTLDQLLIKEFSHHRSDERTPPLERARVGKICPQVEQPVVHILDGLTSDDVPAKLMRHRIMELLLAMEELGVIWETEAPTLCARVRRLVRGHPSAKHDTDHVTAALGMSEATLRRRLRAEGTSLSDIVSETRLDHALTLVQSSSIPVTQVAFEAGFESASAFSRSFRRRFGLSPTGLRATVGGRQSSLSGNGSYHATQVA
jgi:AraC-like DNA-binding protein